MNPGTVLMSGTEVYDTTRWGTFFEIPVGTNVGPATQNFSYASLHIIASQNGTTVQVDTNGDGTIDRSTTLNIGDSYFVNGGISAGATVTANVPKLVWSFSTRSSPCSCSICVWMSVMCDCTARVSSIVFA